MENEISIYGSLLQAYKICPRQAWLMSRNLIGNQDHETLVIGRMIAETTYKKNKKEIRVGNNILDIVKFLKREKLFQLFSPMKKRWSWKN